MRMSLSTITMLTCMTIALGGCGGSNNSPPGSITVNDDAFEVSAPISTKEADGGSIDISLGSSGYADSLFYINVNITNNCSEAIVNASCNVTALKGTTVLGTGFAYFSEGETISPGQSAQGGAIFFNVTKSTEFDQVSMSASNCSWSYN